jgi:unsaturated rhamnogalacturonyl hydrolase
MRIRSLISIAVSSLLTLAVHASGQVKEFSRWPAGSSPQEIGKRVAERFLSLPHTLSTNQARELYIDYPESVTWYGALTFAQLSRDNGLNSRLIDRFNPLFGPEAKLIPEPKHVDLTVFGSVSLEIYIETRQQKYLELGKTIADRQWADPTPDSLTSQTRYWIDDMYMITLVEVQAYRATADPKYLDRAALEMSAYLDKLQQPNGLFYHAPDAPFFWGRGNGWVVAGMVELLRSMPKSHPRRARIMSAYHPEAWPESSSTGMFTFAMITGVKNGWLPKNTYAPAARKAWLALITYLEPNGDIRNVCEGTGKKNDLQYYLDRKRNTGDLHGEAPVLWAASALLR